MATPAVNSIGALADSLKVGQKVDVDMSLVSLTAYGHLGLFVSTDWPEAAACSIQESVAKADEKWITALDKRYGTATVTCVNGSAQFLICHLVPLEEHSGRPSQVGGTHYASMGMDVIDYCRANMPHMEFMAALRFNVQKYIWRKKGSALEDYRKARDYIDRMIEAEEEAVNGS